MPGYRLGSAREACDRRIAALTACAIPAQP